MNATVSPRLSHRIALVTGAGTGIGAAIAVRLAREGADVAVNYARSKEGAEKVAAECRAHGVRAVAVQADVADERQVDAMFAAVEESLGPIDVLVNNSGIQKPSPSERVAMEDFDRVLGVNLRGAFLCARAALRSFLKSGKKGSIVNNSSVHELIPKPLYLPYSITKGGLENMTRTLALEFAERGIRVNSVGPGAIDTPINKAWTGDPKARQEVESHIPMGRAGRPEEIAAVVAFLASDDASYVTGQTVFACGGLTLYPEFRRAWSSGE